MTLDQLERYLKELAKTDPDRVDFLKEKLFGPDGLMITSTKPPRKTRKYVTR